MEGLYREVQLKLVQKISEGEIYICQEILVTLEGIFGECGLISDREIIDSNIQMVDGLFESGQYEEILESLFDYVICFAFRCS